MAVRFLKQAEKSSAAADATVSATVLEILSEIEAGGEAKTRAYAERFDNWSGEIVVPPEWFRDAEARLPETVAETVAGETPAA